jgi:hypothetical protein
MKRLPLFLIGVTSYFVANGAMAATTYGILESAHVSRTYNVVELEQLYSKKFCSALSNSECKKNIAAIKQMPAFGGFDLNAKPISNNSAGISTISNNKILYSSVAARSDEKVTLSGKIIMPNGVSKDKIKGVSLYFHPTIFDPNSIQDVKNDGSDDIVYAALYASQGYIVVMPDYNGLGDDYQEVHPYVLYPRINDLSGLYLLSAVRKKLESDYKFNSSDKLKLYTAGYSEGAAYSIWFSRLAQTDKIFSNELSTHGYQLKASVGMDGAYDVSQTVKNFLFDKVSKANDNPYKIQNLAISSAVKPGLAAVALISYGYMSGYQDTDIDSYRKLFNPKFFDMKCSSNVMPNTLCKVKTSNQEYKDFNLYQTLRFAAANNDKEILTPILFSAFNKEQNGSEYVRGLSLIAISSQNSLAALANSNLVTDQKFNTQLKAADITDWHTNLPVHYISLNYDSVVSPVNTSEASRDTVGNGSNLVRTTLVDNNQIKVDNLGASGDSAIPQLGKTNVDHLRGGTFLNIAALHYFNSN